MNLNRTSVAAAGTLGAALFLACSGNSSDSGSTPDASTHVCAPGQSVACVGVGGCQGGQTCNGDGSGYGGCMCGASGDGGAPDSGAADASSDGTSQADSAEGGGGSGCSTYTSSTVAAMRQGSSGCFSLANVVSIAVTPSHTDVSLHVQDAAGGSFSAMRASCSSTSPTHPCVQAAAVASIPDGHSVTVTGSYTRSASTHAEAFYIDSIADIATVTVPPAATVTLATIQRSSTAYDMAYQKVSVSLVGSLVMYDWTPAELAVAGATCPHQLGFGMAPMSAGLTATAACSNGTSQPAGQPSPSSAEVLIGTDFYSGFTVTSDCRCAQASHSNEPSASSVLTGTIRGLLVWTVPSGAATGYMYFAPEILTDASISATVPGM